MGRTLYLHIGHFKTGTTALQVFLARNPDFLARHGLDYAEAFRKNAKHSALAFSIYRAAGVETLMHGYADPTPPEEMWTLLFDHVRECPQQGVIVSSEEFMRMGGIEAALPILPRLARLGRDIEIRVIAYLRAPDAHLRSWYNQLVKMRQKVPDFNAAVREVIEPVHLDYALALRPWVETFGAGNVVVRPYEESFRGGTGLYADFLSTFGIDMPESGLSLPEGDPNPRLDDRVLELVRVMQNAGVAQKLVRQIRDRAVEHLTLDPEAADFEAIAARSRAAAQEVAGLPASSIDAAAFAARAPAPQDAQTQAQARIAGFLLDEINLLRTRLNRTQRDITARLEALERARPGAAKGKGAARRDAS